MNDWLKKHIYQKPEKVRLAKPATHYKIADWYGNSKKTLKVIVEEGSRRCE